MLINDLAERLNQFADDYCKPGVNPEDLRFISDMCYALGIEPQFTLRKQDRQMVAGDIYLTMERLPPEFEDAIYSGLEGLYEESAPPKAAQEQEPSAG